MPHHRVRRGRRPGRDHPFRDCLALADQRAGRGYAVTALVDDGTIYRSAPVQVGGR